MTPSTAPPTLSDRAQILTGEALAIMRELPAASFDAVVTDPPYCSGGITNTDRITRTAREKYVSSDSAAGHAMPDFSGDQRDQRSFTLWSSIWMSEALRLTRPGGQLLTFTDWRQLPAVSDALQIAGWRWRGIIVWAKRSARPQPGFRNECEYVLWASHGALDRDHRMPYLPGVYTHASPRGAQRQHITAKPVELMLDLVRALPDDARVLDPFAGSGTTGVAAIRTARQFVGIEGSPEYAHVARDRIAAASHPPATPEADQQN
ncbi:DNA-methyltransferase [Nocardia farcinica]|uniref:DNA-methyltransferase n=1 Tax=Nocardia farcinica TaxID=37329 RepID=UPI003413359F